MTNRILNFWGPQEHGDAVSVADDSLDAEYLRQKGQQFLRDAKIWIGDHPGAALGAALLTGVLLGWLVKRR